MKNKRVIALIALAAAFAVSVFAGCDLGDKTTSTGTNDTEISYPTFEPEKSSADTSKNDSAPAEKEQSSDAVNEEPAPESEPSAQESSELYNSPLNSITKEEAVEYAVKYANAEENSSNMKNISSEYEQCINKSPDMTLGEFAENTKRDYTVFESSKRVREMVIDFCSKETGKEKFDDDFLESCLLGIAQLEYYFYGLDDETYFEMEKLVLTDDSVNRSPMKYGWGGGVYLKPFMQAQVAGIEFDTSKRLTLDGIKQIISETQQIENKDERSLFLNKQINDAQAYPDYICHVNDLKIGYCIREQSMSVENCVYFDADGTNCDYELRGNISYYDTNENGDLVLYLYDVTGNTLKAE